MIDVYAFRHGQTDWNAQHLMQGHTDIPLNELGREQAKALQGIFKENPMDLLLTSDLQRASETARIAFSGIDIKTITTEFLREMNLGDAEGTNWTEVDNNFGTGAREKWISFGKGFVDFSFPGGESKLVHGERVCGIVESEARANNSSRVAVSTHGGTIYRFLHACKNCPDNTVKVGNGEVHLFRIDQDGWSYSGTGDV